MVGSNFAGLFLSSVTECSRAGYPRTSGTKATAAELDDIFGGLERSELLAPTRLLTGLFYWSHTVGGEPTDVVKGYVPGAEGLRAVAKLARKLKQERPDLIYLLDRAFTFFLTLYVSSELSTMGSCDG